MGSHGTRRRFYGDLFLLLFNSYGSGYTVPDPECFGKSVAEFRSGDTLDTMVYFRNNWLRDLGRDGRHCYVVADYRRACVFGIYCLLRLEVAETGSISVKLNYLYVDLE